LNNATGTAGSSPGWDKLNINGSLNIIASSGNKFIIDITSLTLANASGAAANFNSSSNYTWVIASASGGITGFDTSSFDLNTAGFSNNVGSGTFSLTTNATDVILQFTAGTVGQQPTNFVTTAAGQGTFTGSPNTSYTIEYADVLATPTVWQTLTTVVTDGSGLGTFSDPFTPSQPAQRFYRVKNP
jgi:hypothetical protein